ncbi:hypothetical protein GDO86_015372 [Hymenochirus boettgeri]|uniref:G-protein coupled receptors family 2 profile 2 domain-containing protein n=1 Tax=Hymenochirus boettgeri TaxID=247094 RepID=A0A8T2JV80_9PIPI|nr:hypothetical protein GDO86_015372 [Hymenochirus boettgeri]
MATVRLTRMCCQVTDLGTSLIMGFRPEIFHGLIVCSAAIGITVMGICYYCSYAKKDQQSTRMGKTLNVASFLGTSGLLLRSIIFLSAPDFFPNQSAVFSHIVCVMISTWIHYFYSVLFWAFFCYSLEVVQLFSPSPNRFRELYTFICWCVPSLLCLQGFLMLVISSGPENRCDSAQGFVLFHDIVIYIPFLLALVGSPFLLKHAMSKVPAVLKMQCGIYTSSERFRKQNLCRKCLQICSIFIGCWICNILCDFLLFLLEIQDGEETYPQIRVAALTTWVVMGIMNPMFCCLNYLAFFEWRISGGGNHSTIHARAEIFSDPGSREDHTVFLEKQHLLSKGPPYTTQMMTLPKTSQMIDLGVYVGE